MYDTEYIVVDAMIIDKVIAYIGIMVHFLAERLQSLGCCIDSARYQTVGDLKIDQQKQGVYRCIDFVRGRRGFEMTYGMAWHMPSGSRCKR